MDRYLEVARGRKVADLVLKDAFILNVFTNEIIKGDVAIVGDRIAGVGTYSGLKELDCSGKYLVPGLIDAHMHIESTMVMPYELSKKLLRAGTTTIIADPHELVNVKGTDALDFILEATENLPMSAYIMLPSSVPATDTEINGSGEFLSDQMEKYINHPRVLGLGEVMRFWDVVEGRSKMVEKLELCSHKVIDGHAPGLTGHPLQAYRMAGIDNDHECSTEEEALEKIRAGFHIFIREGSGAKNLDQIVTGFLKQKISFEQCMFCTDDIHLEDIERQGHINYCVRRAISLGVPIATAYKMASYYTARVYGLKDLGAIGAGYLADLLVMNDLEEAVPEIVIKNGKIVEDSFFESYSYQMDREGLCNTVIVSELTKEQISLATDSKNHVIQMLKKQLTTKHLYEEIPSDQGYFIPNKVWNKLCVIERHGKTGSIGVAPLKGFGIEGGALATTVAHDSHNIIVVGDNDEDILAAVKELKQMQGGYVIISKGQVVGKLILPICGLMSDQTAETVQETLKEMLVHAGNMGVSEDIDPFITLSFMALTVIPEIRLTVNGLYYEAGGDK